MKLQLLFDVPLAPDELGGVFAALAGAMVGAPLVREETAALPKPVDAPDNWRGAQEVWRCAGAVLELEYQQDAWCDVFATMRLVAGGTVTLTTGEQGRQLQRLPFDMQDVTPGQAGAAYEALLALFGEQADRTDDEPARVALNVTEAIAGGASAWASAMLERFWTDHGSEANPSLGHWSALIAARTRLSGDTDAQLENDPGAIEAWEAIACGQRLSRRWSAAQAAWCVALLSPWDALARASAASLLPAAGSALMVAAEAWLEHPNWPGDKLAGEPAGWFALADEQGQQKSWDVLYWLLAGVVPGGYLEEHPKSLPHERQVGPHTTARWAASWVDRDAEVPVLQVHVWLVDSQDGKVLTWGWIWNGVPGEGVVMAWAEPDYATQLPAHCRLLGAAAFQAEALARMASCRNPAVKVDVPAGLQLTGSGPRARAGRAKARG